MKKVNMLSKSEMKNILGGSEPVGSCTADCKDGGSVTCVGALCTALSYDKDTGVDGSCTGTTNRQCSQ